MNEFLFELKQTVYYKDEQYIIVGKAMYVGYTGVKYLLQKHKDFSETGVNFTKCMWVDEMVLENEKNEEE